MGINRNWTKEETEYLKENWGKISIPVLVKKLNRTESAIKRKANKLGMYSFLKSGEYVTLNTLLQVIGVDNGGYKKISWIRNRNFPVHTKRVSRKKEVRIVKPEEFWKWAEENKDFLDFSNFEKNALGKEPDWVKDKRREDKEKARKYKTTPWTIQEDEKLKYYLKQFRYTSMELSKMLMRTEGAIQKRINDLNLKERPVKADNHVKWTEEEYNLLGEMLKDGKNYEYMSEKLGKSSKAIRGRVYCMYLTENLDKARALIGKGRWGDGRPERKISQYNCMTSSEKRQVKELLERLMLIMEREVVNR